VYLLHFLLNFRIYICFYLLLFSLGAVKSHAQLTVTVCQNQDDALIAPDRNDWAHNNLPIVNDGYLHNFEQPEPPCGINNLTLLSAEISIELINYNTSVNCSGVPVFGNVLLNCPLTNTSVCGIQADMLAPGCGNYAGTTDLGTYTLNLTDCSIFASATDIIGVDLVPATEHWESCPTVSDAVSSGLIQLEYEICITYNYAENVPLECENTISIPCDDGNPCTINDQILADECDPTIICIPCTGTLQADCSETVTLPCNDGNDCTINDQMVVSACDQAFICEACEGELAADCENTITLPCDDGNECTINDVLTVSACDETFICEECLGVQVESCELTLELPCDDGNDCTYNDIELVDACNNSVVCIPCTGTPVSPMVCDDGDCSNGLEYWDESLCSCQTYPVEELGCTDPSACDFNALATCDSGCDYSCLDCLGVIDGTATFDVCGICLAADDPERDISCFNQLYVPNAFTPDNDGVNDVFKIGVNRDMDFFEIRIFNRFGTEIYYSSDSNFSWQGDVNSGEYYAPPGVYSYSISYSFNYPLIKKTFGFISIVR